MKHSIKRVGFIMSNYSNKDIDYLKNKIKRSKSKKVKKEDEK